MNSFNQYSKILKLLKFKNYKSLGLVPTMGSLHKGHSKLIEKSTAECDETIVSIFVNPTQFNDKKDLITYPRNLQKDIEIIKKINPNIIIYTPKVSDLYLSPVKAGVFDLDGVDKIIEGKFRKGHFQGVATVIKLLFEKFSPDYAFFGEKDYQQLVIIKKLVEKNNLKVKIKAVSTEREENGLAISSRNKLLDIYTLKNARILFDCLCTTKKMIKTHDFNEIKKIIYRKFDNNKSFNLEYLCIAEETSLKEAKIYSSKIKLRAFISASSKGVRLIDNIALY